MRSLVRERPGEAYKPFAFDQPHILTVIAVYKLPRGWQIGGRFRLVSGNPTTRYTDGIYDACRPSISSTSASTSCSRSSA